MTHRTHSLTRFIPTIASAPKPTLLARLMAWDAAWREKRRVGQLDAAALRDLGLTDRQRRDITVQEIIRRTGY